MCYSKFKFQLYFPSFPRTTKNKYLRCDRIGNVLLVVVPEQGVPGPLALLRRTTEQGGVVRQPGEKGDQIVCAYLQKFIFEG